MFVSTKDYLKRVTYALEHVAAPLIESDFARGQVLAAVFLIDNLTERIDYKPELINKEIEKCVETIKGVIAPMKEELGDVPEEVETFIEECSKEDVVKNIALRDRADEMLCVAIDYFFANKDKLDTEGASSISKLVVKNMTDMNMRDLGMLQVSTSSKLIQAKSDK